MTAYDWGYSDDPCKAMKFPDTPQKVTKIAPDHVLFSSNSKYSSWFTSIKGNVLCSFLFWAEIGCFKTMFYHLTSSWFSWFSLSSFVQVQMFKCSNVHVQMIYHLSSESFIQVQTWLMMSRSLKISLLLPPFKGKYNNICIIITMMIIMVTQHIPTRWESDIMMKGGNMTQSNSHHTYI